jgi:hypothetical protein
MGLDSQAGRLGLGRRPATALPVHVNLTAASVLRPVCVLLLPPAARWVLDRFFQRRLALPMRCCAAGVQQSAPFWCQTLPSQP